VGRIYRKRSIKARIKISPTPKELLDKIPEQRPFNLIDKEKLKDSL
jgi:hypothetical protein